MEKFINLLGFITSITGLITLSITFYKVYKSIIKEKDKFFTDALDV